MINKQSLWFITLFSLILILGIYYVTMPTDTLATFTENILNEQEVIEVTDDDVLAAIKVNEEEKLQSQMSEYQSILLNNESTLEEKNNAYESLLLLSNQKNKCEELEKLVKEKFNLNSVVSINKDNINVTLSSNEPTKTLANDIINEIQSTYQSHMYITIKFETN